MQTIIHDHLSPRERCSRWVPPKLTNQQKDHRNKLEKLKMVADCCDFPIEERGGWTIGARIRNVFEQSKIYSMTTALDELSSTKILQATADPIVDRIQEYSVVINHVVGASIVIFHHFTNTGDYGKNYLE
ncbi:hypothetical protein EVAR_97889_1 [Eumeta japonica]|uniref:Uncharacterized protein n=1 Tax=Eumeta variegata TaxID=151549 RepID=A0A4C1WGH0_EUMVA|nr:hypothetical protein EVAR_97889_1 [Eumeta japonica]